MSYQKLKPIRSDAIRRAAKDAKCSICGARDETIVFCHLNEGWAGKGMGKKADDFGFYACHGCHNDYDGRNGVNAIPEMWEILRACYLSWRFQIESDVIIIRGMK
jgi:hypothetical protein